MKKVAIVQSNYIPWKGYFDLISSVDEFVLFDDMQFTRRDWRNRNQIKTPQGLQWLTIPVIAKGKFEQKINETLIDGTSWASDHWKAIHLNYRRAKFFDEISDWLIPLFTGNTDTHLSPLNERFIRAICKYLGINTRISHSTDFNISNCGKSERLMEICRCTNATQYVSGPAAKDYLDSKVFEGAGIDVAWFDYSGYPEYPQLWNDEFVHGVSIVDLLFNCGRESNSKMKHVPK